MNNDKTSRLWFEDAVRCHVECHQGCPWCGKSHCVYHLIQGKKRIFSCQHCDFRASYDQTTGEYTHLVGEQPSSADTAAEQQLAGS